MCITLDDEAETQKGCIANGTSEKACTGCKEIPELKEKAKGFSRQLNQAIRDKTCKRFCANRKRAIDLLEERKEECVLVAKETFTNMKLEMERMRQQLKDRDQYIQEIKDELDKE